MSWAEETSRLLEHVMQASAEQKAELERLRAENANLNKVVLRSALLSSVPTTAPSPGHIHVSDLLDQLEMRASKAWDQGNHDVGQACEELAAEVKAGLWPSPSAGRSSAVRVSGGYPYETGFADGRNLERQLIVEWLRANPKITIKTGSPLRESWVLDGVVHAIEGGEHLR